LKLPVHNLEISENCIALKAGIEIFAELQKVFFKRQEFYFSKKNRKGFSSHSFQEPLFEKLRALTFWIENL